jgi:serine/threonine-protein kinase
MRYRLIERIGSGGMAEVFRAVAEGPHGFARTVVIKRILPRLATAPEFVRMFIDEAKISARLSHPNIVQTFAFGEPGGTPVLVMEHVDGRDLGAILRRLADGGRAVPPPVVAEIARQCCEALDYAHRLSGEGGAPVGLVHRDVTPSNIMVSWEGNVKLLDFGIARAKHEARESETAAGTMKGKMGYVAPEQITKGAADARSDLYALGAVMHEALTGKRLFLEGNDLATLMSVLEKRIEPPSATNPAVGPTLDRIVMRALRRDPSQRFASASAFGTALEGYLSRARPVINPGRAVRAFMLELAPLFNQAPARSATPAAGEGTIALQEVELVAGAAERAPEDASGPPPFPPRGRRRRRSIVAASAAGALLLLAGLASYPRTGAPAHAASDLVQIVLDSTPQGALVTREGDGEPVPLGETPVLLELPRGGRPLSFHLRKEGYEPLIHRLIPNGSAPAVVKLRRAREGGSKTASVDGDLDP